MYKCYTSDLDGTLANSIYAIRKPVNDTLSYQNAHEISVEESRLYVGSGYERLLGRSFTACGNRELAHYDEAVDRYQDIFRECCMRRVEAYRGIREFLEFLKSQGILIAVLSSRPHPRALDGVKGVFGKGYSSLVHGERENKRIRKEPCPDDIWAIAKELGPSKSEIPYPGNIDTNIETGDSAEMDTMGVTWGFQTREELMAFHPAFTADHPSRVIQYIRDVNGIE